MLTPLHFRKVSAETREFNIFDLKGLIMTPRLLNTRSSSTVPSSTSTIKYQVLHLWYIVFAFNFNHMNKYTSLLLSSPCIHYHQHYRWRLGVSGNALVAINEAALQRTRTRILGRVTVCGGFWSPVTLTFDLFNWKSHFTYSCPGDALYQFWFFYVLQGVSLACYAGCPSVRPSHAGIEWKRRKLGSRNLHRRIAQGL